MKPIYLDLHIHTSEDEENLNQNYDVDLLLSKIQEVSHESDFLISLTDHNTINKTAYLKLLEKTQNVILGVELHVINSENKPPYHCHFYFNVDELNVERIDSLNEILDKLYPNKKVSPPYETVKNIEEIIKEFDDYDFLVLPHGGQSHSTFDKSIDTGTHLDTRLKKSLYYNYFDGFTARNKDGLDTTISYFKRLGINEFINLITCTDNYSPATYPASKAGSSASPFLPTWMLAEPTFEGLRISLSESLRLVYSENKPSDWAEYIRSVNIDNDFLDIDVTLTPGLNVVIGDSSSGKTLFVDTIVCKAKGSFDKSKYRGYNVVQTNVFNPSGNIPHYIDQNFITSLIAHKGDKIEEIAIIKKIFPEDENTKAKLSRELSILENDIDLLIGSIENIEKAENEISAIPVLSMLIKKTKTKENIVKSIIPLEDLIVKMDYQDYKYKEDIDYLDKIEAFMKMNVFADYDENDFKIIKEKLKDIFYKSQKETNIRNAIFDAKSKIDTFFLDADQESETKRQNFEKLLKNIKVYKDSLNTFNKLLAKMQDYSVNVEGKDIELMGHNLSIEYTFKLTNDIFLKKVNELLKPDYKVSILKKPNQLYKIGYKDNPPINTYEVFKTKLKSNFRDINKKRYKIVTNDGKDFNSLSAGWKTSILLDLILGYTGDTAPLIIDQPEDNLANSYINNGLIRAIKDTKRKKQVIVVSHNATIPMLADAQNIILCENKEGKIVIRSNPLEGMHSEKRIVDHIASITDGGKHSIRKRFKKYNMKNFEE
jgi:hypothetical protein